MRNMHYHTLFHYFNHEMVFDYFCYSEKDGFSFFFHFKDLFLLFLVKCCQSTYISIIDFAFPIQIMPHSLYEINSHTYSHHQITQLNIVTIKHTRASGKIICVLSIVMFFILLIMFCIFIMIHLFL